MEDLGRFLADATAVCGGGFLGTGNWLEIALFRVVVRDIFWSVFADIWALGVTFRSVYW